MKISNIVKFSFKKENFDIKKIGSFIFNFFLNNLGFVFIVFFVVMVILSSILIYKYVYGSVWNETEKNNYFQEIKKDNLNFKPNAFNDVLDQIKKREIKYQNQDKLEVKDIFGLEVDF